MVRADETGTGTAILKLLASEDHLLLVKEKPLRVLDIGLHVLFRVVGLDLYECDGLSGQGLHEDHEALHRADGASKAAVWML